MQVNYKLLILSQLFGLILGISKIPIPVKIHDGACPWDLIFHAERLTPRGLSSGETVHKIKATKCWEIPFSKNDTVHRDSFVKRLHRARNLALYGVKIKGFLKGTKTAVRIYTIFKACSYVKGYYRTSHGHEYPEYGNAFELLYMSTDIPSRDLTDELYKKIYKFGNNSTSISNSELTSESWLPKLSSFNEYNKLYPGITNAVPCVQNEYKCTSSTNGNTVTYRSVVYRYKIRQSLFRQHSFFFGIILQEEYWPKSGHSWKLVELIPYKPLALSEHAGILGVTWNKFPDTNWTELDISSRTSSTKSHLKYFYPEQFPSSHLICPVRGQILEYIEFNQGIGKYEIFLYDSYAPDKLYWISRFKYQKKYIYHRISFSYENEEILKLNADALVMTAKIMIWTKVDNDALNLLHDHLKDSIVEIKTNTLKDICNNNISCPEDIKLLYAGKFGEYNYGVKTNTYHLLLFEAIRTPVGEEHGKYFTVLAQTLVSNKPKIDEKPNTDFVEILNYYEDLLEIMMTNKNDLMLNKSDNCDSSPGKSVSECRYQRIRVEVPNICCDS